MTVFLLGVGAVLFTSVNVNAYIPDDIRPVHETTTVPYDDEIFHDNLSSNGFEVSSYWKGFSYDKRENDLKFYDFKFMERGIINHYTTLHDALLQSKTDSKYYAYIYKVTVNPKQVRNWGFLGIGSSGDNWYFESVTSYCTLPNGSRITLFSPTNSPSSWSESVGVGVTAGYGEISAQISCDVSYPVNELNVYSKSDFINYYYTKYIDEHRGDYTRNSSSYYGMFVFKYNGTPKITVNHKIKYFGREFYAYFAHGDVSFTSSL